MKKLLSIVFLCAVVTATGTNEKEIEVNNFENFEVEKSEFQQEISNREMLIGCGQSGNLYYYNLVNSGGMSHIDARRERRAYVRECRGHFWQWPWT